MMKAFIVDRYGSKDGVRAGEMPDPELREDDVLVHIHAGSGGVGTFAIQLAKHLGAIVATTTSTENLDWVKRLGADIVIDYRKDDFETILHDYDVVLDS